MGDLTKMFNYSGRQIRIVVMNEEPWFVAKDVCEVLELDDARKAVDRLDEDERILIPVTDSLGRTQETWAVNEAGLYSLVLGSRKPEAKQFKRWVTHEVLPDIRKHGIYATDNVVDRILDNPDFGIKLLMEYKAEKAKRKALELENAQKTQIIHELQPKATYYDLVLQNKSLLPITKIAKDYGMSGQAFNTLLHELGIQYKMGDTWLLYAKYADKGYTQSRTHVIDADKSKINTYWTQKGRLFIYDLLKSKKNILPLIEREHQKDA